MKRFIIAAFALACAFSSPVHAKTVSGTCGSYGCVNDLTLVAQATPSTTNVQTTAETPTPPASVTTVVKGGTFAADLLQWLQVALVPTLGLLFVGLIKKGMDWLGIQTTQQQSDQLQNVVVNGLNSAMERAQLAVRENRNLDLNVQSQVIADAVAYTQEHAKETLTAMGLDPNSGKATDKIRAKILTVINDPTKPTPAALTPKA